MSKQIGNALYLTYNGLVASHIILSILITNKILRRRRVKISNMKYIKFVMGLFMLYALSSCSEGENMLKKFESRLNADEFDCAASYIYDGDNPTFTFFVDEILKKNENLLIEVDDSNNETVNGEEVVIAKFRLKNSNSKVDNFFENLGYHVENGCFTDTIRLRETNEGKKLSFRWGVRNTDEGILRVAKFISSDNGVSSITMNIKSGGSRKIETGDETIVDTHEGKKLRCYVVDHQGKIREGSIPNTQIELKNKSYSTLGIIDSMSVLTAVIVLVIVVLVFGGIHLIASAFMAIPVGGIFLLVGSILGLIYCAYQLLEKILFELFIINLPY